MVLEIAAKAFAIWVSILILAVANGALREALLIPWLGETPGLLLSGALLATLILAIAYVAVPWLGAREASVLIAVGIGWLVLTVVFEFSFGWVQGKSWPTLLEAYTFRHGNIWPLVLLVTVCAPYLAAKLRGWL